MSEQCRTSASQGPTRENHRVCGCFSGARFFLVVEAKVGSSIIILGWPLRVDLDVVHLRGLRRLSHPVLVRGLVNRAAAVLDDAHDLLEVEFLSQRCDRGLP
eukprot:3506724-Pyramimonas_sp.AAC.1